MIRAPHRRWRWYIGRPQTFRNSGKCGQRHRKWSIWAYYLHISSFGPWLWQPAHIECSTNVKITNIIIIMFASSQMINALCDMSSPTSPIAEGSSVEKVMKNMKANAQAPWAAGQDTCASQILQNRTIIIWHTLDHWPQISIIVADGKWQ